MKKDNKKIEINNMIALCHIVDDFARFEKRLISTMSQKNDEDFAFQIQDISKGKFKLGARIEKNFYEENKSVIDTINQYSSIEMLIYQNYKYNGEYYGDLRFFYEYLENHRMDISKILNLLEKIKNLGFYRIELNEDIDFTQKIYRANPSNDDFYLTYVANPQVIPSYTDDINFITADSNYEMTIGPNRIVQKIVLNSLLFEPNTLPEKIDTKHIQGQLVKLKNNQQTQTNIIRNSIDLSISISDLERQFYFTNQTIDRLNEVKNKEELVKILTRMKEDLEKLKELSIEYNSTLLKEEPLLTSELLEKEKKLYLERKACSNIDLC